MNPVEVTRLRDAVDHVNGQIVALLAARQQLTSEIGRHKASAGIPVHVPERELEMFERLRTWCAQHGLDWATAERVFVAIVEGSKQAQAAESEVRSPA